MRGHEETVHEGCYHGTAHSIGSGHTSATPPARHTPCYTPTLYPSCASEVPSVMICHGVNLALTRRRWHSRSLAAGSRGWAMLLTRARAELGQS